MKKSPFQYRDIYPPHMRATRWMHPVFDDEVARSLGYQKFWPTRELVVVSTGIVLGVPLAFLLAFFLVV